MQQSIQGQQQLAAAIGAAEQQLTIETGAGMASS